MNLLFLADLHIHFPKKVPKAWQRNRFMMLAEEINKVECDLVVLGGDTLDSAKPTTSELELFFDFLAAINHDVIIYSGNHEMQSKKHSVMWDLESEIYRCNAHYEIKVLKSGSYKCFDIVDYPDLHAEYLNKNKICFTHVRGAIEPHVKPEVDLAKFSKWKLVLAGDLHSNENSQLNILYPGSPLTTSFHRTRQTKANGMYLVDMHTLKPTWINLSHLPQQIKITTSNPEEMVETEYDYTIYELEGNISDLAKVQKTELLDKKINNVVQVEAKLDIKDKPLSEQMSMYLSEIQKLPTDIATRLLTRFTKYAIKKTNI